MQILSTFIVRIKQSMLCLLALLFTAIASLDTSGAAEAALAHILNGKEKLTEHVIWAELARKPETFDATKLFYDHCLESVLKCCTAIIVMKAIHMKGKSLDGEMIHALGVGAWVSGPKRLQFACCEVVADIHIHPHAKEFACSSSYTMTCPFGFMPVLEEVKTVAVDDLGHFEPYFTTTGFCVPHKGMVKEIIQAGQTRCLDVPEVVEGLIAGEAYIYVWYTTTAERPSPIATNWTKIKIKGVEEFFSETYHLDHARFGPAKTETVYEVCINAFPDADTVLHLRLGGRDSGL